MGCAASSQQNQSVSVPQKIIAGKQQMSLTQPQTTKQTSVDKRVNLQNITGQTEKINSATNITKQGKISNPQDTQGHTQKRQTTSRSRDTNSRSKGRGIKSSQRNRQPISDSNVVVRIEPTQVTSKGQMISSNINSKSGVSPSRMNIKIADNKHREHTTAEDEVVNPNDKQSRYERQSRNIRLAVQTSNETSHKQVDSDKKKKHMRQSKKKTPVDPKLNALIQIYGFD